MGPKSKKPSVGGDSEDLAVIELASIIKGLHADMLNEVTTLKSELASVKLTLSSVENSITTITNKVETLTEKQKDLTNSVGFAHAKIEDMEVAVSKNADVISGIERATSVLKEAERKATDRRDSLEIYANSLEAYTRQWSVRVTGLDDTGDSVRQVTTHLEVIINQIV